MTVSFDGANKLIILSVATSFTLQTDIYDAAIQWATQTGNMQYLLPMQGSGHMSLGGGVYTDAVYTLVNGWKIQPSGYAANTQVKLLGTIATSDGGNYALAPSSGSPVQWYAQVATAGVVVAQGSGMSAEEHNALMAVKKIGENAWEMKSNQLTIYDDDGTTPLRTFDLKDQNGSPSMTNVYKRTPA